MGQAFQAVRGVFMEHYLVMFLRLLLSAVLGGLIGFERENKNRPAGLRTNTLVCIGAALVQIVNIEIFNQYKGMAALGTNVGIDPTRLSAQVISGIGFLGAGTIIREGASVKGLTTAAGLWVVACIGIAIGNGSYAAAIMGAAFAYITLRAMKIFEERMNKKNAYLDLEIKIDDRPGQIGRIGQFLGNMDINIRNIEFRETDGNSILIFLSLKLPKNLKKQEIVATLMGEMGISSVEEVA